MEIKGINKVVSVYAEESVSVFTIFHSNPSRSGQDVSLKTINVNLMVALEEKSGDLQSQ